MKMLSRMLIGGLALSGAIFLSSSLTTSAFAAGHAFVGESQCEDCHGAKEAAKNYLGPDGQPTNPVAVWQADTHHTKANAALTDDWGKQVAAKAKVDVTAADAPCLKCHATGAGSDSALDPGEGVSCEACHGAAADYVKKTVHGVINDQAAQMQVAVAAGLLDVRKTDIREANCKNCHTTERPCVKPGEKPFDLNSEKKIQHWRASIPVI
jgi:hypothetical protein